MRVPRSLGIYLTAKKTEKMKHPPKNPGKIIIFLESLKKPHEGKTHNSWTAIAEKK